MNLTQFELQRIWHYDSTTGIFTRLVSTARNTKIGDVADCCNSWGYIQFMVLGKRYLSHRLAFLYMTGKFPTNEVDHINRIRTDNRWCNLRDVTKSINEQNKRTLRIDNTSGYSGVDWLKTRGKWRVKIKVSSKIIYLGLFDDVHAAGAHYLKKKRELHPECSI